jgi:glycosyltransferase involved in cell wall biosynthesis
MKISVITVVLNDKENIGKTIASVIGQKDVNFEYIVIDGASVDGTSDVIEQYRESIDFFISERDEGIADAFNKGITKASGDIVGIVNSGDFLEEGALERVAHVFAKETDVVYGNVRYWDGEQPEYVYKADHRLLVKFMSVNHPAVFVRKELYERLGGFDKGYTMAMDYELILRFYLAGACFCYTDTVLSNMALGGVSDLRWREAYKEAYEIRRRYLGSGLMLQVEYRFQVLKRRVSNLLSFLGLDSIKRLYRCFVSPIKKKR